MGYKGTHKGETIDREITRVLTGEVVTDNTVSTLDPEEVKPISSKAVADKFLKLQITAGAEPYTFEQASHDRAVNEQTFVRLFELIRTGKFDPTFPVYLTFSQTGAEDWLIGSGSVLSSDVSLGTNDDALKYHFLVDAVPAREGCRTIIDIYIYGSRTSLTTSKVTIRGEFYNIPTDALLAENSTIEKYRNEYSAEISRIKQYKENFDKKDRFLVQNTTAVTAYELALVRYSSVCSSVVNTTKTLSELIDYINNTVKPAKQEYEEAVAALEELVSDARERNNRSQKWSVEYDAAVAAYNGYLEKYGSVVMIKSLVGGANYVDKFRTFEDDCDYYINGGNDDETVVSEAYRRYCLAKASFDANGGKFILDLDDIANMENWPMAIKSAYTLSNEISVEWNGENGTGGGKYRLAKVEEDIEELQGLYANDRSSTRVQLQQELVTLDAEFDRLSTLVNNNTPIDTTLNSMFNRYRGAWVADTRNNYRSVLATEAAIASPNIYKFTTMFNNLRQIFYGYRGELMQYIIDNGVQ